MKNLLLFKSVQPAAHKAKLCESLKVVDLKLSEALATLKLLLYSLYK